METIEKIRHIFARITAINDEPRPNPGLPAEETRQKLEAIDISPPKELVQLYEWHNGIGYLNAFFSLLSVDEAIMVYGIFRDFKIEFPDFAWQKSWYPVFTTNGDIHHCVDLDSGAVIDIDLECDIVNRIADHYDDILDAMMHVLDNELYRFDTEGGFIECKDGEWAKVEEEFNIKATHW